MQSAQFDIDVRLRRLERENRGLRTFCGLLLLLTVGGIGARVTAQPRSAQAITARSFVVEDADGKIRASFALRGLQPVLSLFDEKGAERVHLAVSPDGPTLRWLDQNGRLHEMMSQPGLRPATEP